MLTFSFSVGVKPGLSKDIPFLEMTESNKKKLGVNLTAPDQEPDADKSMLRNGAVAKVISKPSGPGLLDLPPEIRLMIFRHLLVRPSALETYYRSFPKLDILKTLKLIYKEAFDVFYKENSFSSWLWGPYYKTPKITRSPQIANTIQSIESIVYLRRELEYPEYLNSDFRELINVMQHLGNSSIIRRSLVVKLCTDTPCLLKGFVRNLGKFTNFKVVKLQLDEPFFS